MIRSLAFTTQGRLHTRDIEMFLMPTLLNDTNLFLWIDLESPTDEEKKFVLETLFHFHPLSIQDCVFVSPAPKVEEFTPKEDDKFAPYLFMVIHAVDYNRKDGRFGTQELNFFLGKNFLVTYHDGPIRSVSLTEERAVKATTHIARAPDRVAYNLLDSIVDNYKPALDELSLEIAELETDALQQPQREVLARFARGEFKLIRAHLVPYYRNVYDGLFHISELAQNYADSLTGILQVYLNMSSNRTAEVVKALTLITILSTPATIIASWYGMNFQKDMHEINWDHGYAFAFAITALSTLVTYLFLKRRNWF
jgi:magnesium transporter